MSPRPTVPLLALLPLLLAAAAAPPSTAPASQPVSQPLSQPAAESKPVEADSVAITLLLQKTTFAADQQPDFTVRFRNTAADGYRNLYDVTAIWNWTIDLLNTDPHAEDPGPWRLNFNTTAHRPNIDHRQLLPGQTTDVPVNLNDPPLTFNFTYAGRMGHLVASVKHLPPGTYRLTAAITLTPPFGPGNSEWTGPLTTSPIELTIAKPIPQAPIPGQEQAYAAAIAKVTDTLDEHGLWMNGITPILELPKNPTPDDIIDAAVNVSSLASKSYRVLATQPFTRNQSNGTAALLQVGTTPKVLIFLPGGWFRFYDTQIPTPATKR